MTAPTESGAGTAFPDNRPLQAIAAGYGALWLWAAIAPHDRFDWLLENLLVFLWLGILVATHRRLTLTTRSYGLIAAFLALHTVGSHYTYALTPAGFWLQEALELERNHYDRIVHFCFGFLLAIPVREVLARLAGLRGGWRDLLTFALVLSCSDLYEMMEWATAQIVSPDAAFAFLGTQGDVFDAQKDTSLAALGALLALAGTALAARARAGRRSGSGR